MHTKKQGRTLKSMTSTIRYPLVSLVECEGDGDMHAAKPHSAT